MKIYTLTANPSVDFYLEVQKVVPEDINRLVSVRKDAGGKGINVSRVLKILGIGSTALGIIGGENGLWLKRYLKKEGVKFSLLEISGETRTIYNILERSTGRIFRFNEPGPQIGPEDFQRFKDYLFTFPFAEESFFVISGSVPPGIPADFYTRIIRYLKKNGLRVVLDSDNELLTNGIASAPEIIKPNLFELGRVCGKKIRTIPEAIKEAKKIITQGVKLVVISLGKDGALGVTKEETVLAIPPQVQLRSSIGAGDALLAGLLAELSRKKGLKQALKMGVAAGTASVLYPGTTFAPLAEITTTYHQIKTRQF